MTIFSSPVSDDAIGPVKPRVVIPARERRRRISVGTIIGWTILAAAVVITIFPFYWMLRTAFSNGRSLPSDPSSLLPVGFTWGAFGRVLGFSSSADAISEGGSGAALNFWRYLLNSIIVATLITAFQMFFSSMAAYGFGRLQWKGRNVLFGVFLTSLMIPGIFTLLPNFILVKDLGLLNTYAGIVLPSVLMTPFAVFFLRQFFLGLPKEIEEAAMIDGANRFVVFFRVTIPMSMGPLATLALLTYIAAWNDYLWPLVVGSSDNVRTLTVAIGIFRSQTPQGAPDWPGLMAATIIAALPILVVYAILGRRIVESLGFSGIK